MQAVELYSRILRVFLHFFHYRRYWRINMGKRETEEKTKQVGKKRKKKKKGENRAEDKRGEGGGER